MLTNFSRLSNEQKTVWSMDLWKAARNYSFVNRFLGRGPNNVIQHITELKKSEKGTRAVITLLADLVGDGVAGDRTLEDNEEAMRSYDQVINVDMLRHAVRSEGRIAEQKSVIDFRSNSKDRLAYWLAERVDQLGFLTLAGVSYERTNNGMTRVGSDFKVLEFAPDVSAPTIRRRLQWNGATKTLSSNGATNLVTASDTPTWELFIQAKAYAKDHYIRGVKESGGEETYHAFMTPQAMAKLKLDPTYMQNLRHAQTRDGTNPLFTGGSVKIDGIYLHEYRNVYNTTGAASGSKWGAAGTVDGCSIAFCGAQALAMADIEMPEWNEKEFDYGNQLGIATGKILGFLKPKFASIYESDLVEDFGVLNIYVAQ